MNVKIRTNEQGALEVLAGDRVIQGIKHLAFTADSEDRDLLLIISPVELDVQLPGLELRIEAKSG